MNEDIREAAAENGVKMWEIAEALGYDPSKLSRMMRKQLPESERQTILLTIAEIARRSKEQKLISSMDNIGKLAAGLLFGDVPAEAKLQFLRAFLVGLAEFTTKEACFNKAERAELQEAIGTIQATIDDVSWRLEGNDEQLEDD